MSKKRLEEIEAKYSTLTVSSEKNSTEYTEVDVKDLVFLIQNGFKQARRAEELEKERSEWKGKYSILKNKYRALQRKMKNRWRYNRALENESRTNEIVLEEFREENKRLKQALEFYADENNYREHDLKGIVPPRPITFKPILHDYGSIARQALEGEE